LDDAVKYAIPLLLICLLVGVFFAVRSEEFTRFWMKNLIVSLPMEKADALIVLGGEALARPQEAARLYIKGVAPKVFVSGEGDAGRNRQILMAAGVPPQVIVTEPTSSSTYANATMLRPILEDSGVHSALIVTSPFHTRRALATFRKVMPEIHFGVVGVSAEKWRLPEGREDVNRLAFIEFLKTMEYRLIHGIAPCPDAPQRPPK